LQIQRSLEQAQFPPLTLFLRVSRFVNRAKTYNAAMSQVNPAGATTLGLVETLIDLVKNPDASRIEVAMASYNLDAQGLKIREGGKHSIALRSFEVKDMNTDTQEQLRQQIEARPTSCLMVLWMQGFAKESKLGAATFDPITNNRKARAATLDEVERFAISDYIQRHRQSVEAESETVH